MSQAKLPRPSKNATPPAGRAALLRIEEIHRRLRAVPRERTGTYRVSTTTLAQELGVARNTIKDDLLLLELFNAPIAYDAGRRTLYYEHSFELRPPVWLQSDEVLALLVAVRLASHSRTFPLGRTLVRALERIAPTLAGAASFGPDALDPVFSTTDATVTEAEARHFAVLCDAITHRREVKIVYRKANHDPAPKPRVVHPLHWLIRPDACLLILHDPVLNERRNFELVRIQDVQPTGATFPWPEGFDLKKHLAGSFGRFVGEPVHEVRVVFDRDYVPLVRERPWQSGQTLVERPDGTAEATYRVCHTADLEQNILRAAGRVEVISPPEVRARLHAAARRLLNRHG